MSAHAAEPAPDDPGEFAPTALYDQTVARHLFDPLAHDPAHRFVTADGSEYVRVRPAELEG